MPLPVDVLFPDGFGKLKAADVREKLAVAARALAKIKRATLEKLKEANDRLKRPDFLWHGLIEAFATMGGAGGWKGLIGNETNYSRLRYDAIKKLPIRRRPEDVLAVCIDARIRYPNRKAEFIVGCFDRIEGLGGMAEAIRELLSQPGRDAKIAFLDSLPGIGEKYARNLMMDVYHEDFRDSIAVDIRIKSISEQRGLSFASYQDEETFYLTVAKAASLNGWMLDRLMFWYQNVFLPPIGF